MENKDRLNHNPESEEIQTPEENATSASDVTKVDQPILPEENQELPVEPATAQETLNEEQTPEPVAAEETAEPEEVAVPEVTEEINEVSSDPVVSEPEVAVAPEPVKDLPQSATTSHAAIHEELFALPIENELEEEEEEEVAEDDSQLNYEELNRKQLVEMLEKAVTESDISLIKKKVANLRIEFEKKNKAFQEEAFKQYISGGGEAETYAPTDDTLAIRFRVAFEKFKQTKARFNEEQEKIKIQNLAQKNQILEELRALINTEKPLKGINDEFKVLQDKWKSNGMVPKNEVTSLWNNYHFLVEKFYDKVRIIKELKDLDLRKNLEAKIAICEKSEDLLINFNNADSFKRLQQLHEEWREIGPVPLDKKEEVWERFKAVSDQINERRHEYYTEVQEELNNNYAAKVALVESAANLASTKIDNIKQWMEITDQFNELLKVWKGIGPAPKKLNDEVWAKFKGYLDGFFLQKRDYFLKLKDQQINNYNLKVNLCVQAEALKDSSDWVPATRDLIRLQKEWKEIGPVPRKQSDKIWKRFRSACDEFFRRKMEVYQTMHSQEESNLQLKLELLKAVQAFEITGDRSECVERLKEFQRQWMEIGHIPFNQKEKLQNEFRSTINAHFDQLKVHSSEKHSANYKSRFENLKDQPEATRIISRERSFLQNKMTELQEEIRIWENNIGFFAKSKNSNILKAELEKKIEKAKEELKALEEKVKILRSV